MVLSVGQGALRLDVGTPTAFIDILDENIDGANALSNSQFEAITSFALSRVVAIGSGGRCEQTGYLVVDGEIQ